MIKRNKKSERPGENVYKSLFDQILEEKLEPGSQLASEQILADQYGVSRTTLRKALDRLRRDHLIITRHGDGNYVAGISASEPRTIELGADADFDQIFEVRRLLEGQAAAHAAAQTDQAMLETVERAHDYFKEMVSAGSIDIIGLRRADIEFHLAIADCSRNTLLKEMIGYFRPGLGPFWLMWLKLDEGQQRVVANDVKQEHELILSAIKVGDSGVAEAAMKHHFQSSEGRLYRLFG